MKRVNQHPILDPAQDRQKVKFFFNGKPYYGYAGEPVSSALIANGVHVFSIHQRESAPKGIFCANGQCSHCIVIIDGVPEKSCVTPLRAGMQVKTLKYLPELPRDDQPPEKTERLTYQCDVLVVGGGPAGLTATIELARLDYKIILVDDKERLGGKLVLQTHKFFGSIADCYAGTRGIDIARQLEAEVREFENVRIFTQSSVVGIYKDQKAGVFINQANYAVVDFAGLVVSAGAREKSLLFNGNDLPNVYGAGAFQTLVNRDLVKAAQRIFIVGSGNVGLIAGYHALQAGIQCVGICDILDQPSGYKVHADKIIRMGVPLYLRHTVISAEGEDKVKRVTIAAVNDEFEPILETAKTFQVDALLIAVGLSPVDEFYDMAQKFGFKVVKTGDAHEIAEASSAMFGGRIAGLEMGKLLGEDITIDPSFYTKAEILKSKPGALHPAPKITLDENFRPVIRCDEEIPCNPCTSVCPAGAIELEEELGNIMDIPRYIDGCTGCQLCVAICPGLAITLARKIDYEWAEVILPYEYIPDFKAGDRIAVTDEEGRYLEQAEVLKVRFNKRFKTYLIAVKVAMKNGVETAGIQVQPEKVIPPLPAPDYNYLPENSVVCRCEMVKVKEVVDYIKTHDIRDVNQLKPLRLGMGACGGKNCSILLPRLFRMAGKDWSGITRGTLRPLSVEIPMSAIINEEAGVEK